MPGTTRYSATFDRPYEEEDEEDLPAVPPLTRRSRSASWQATTANGRPYTPLGGCRGSHVRSASTDNGPQSSSTSTSPAHSTERIPTRTTGKVSVKTSHNPFQFVKVGQCSLYRKAEEQLKKTQKVKQPEALKEEEEEWQTNLDSWKSRRRKMSQDVLRRQEEMKELLEMEVQEPVAQQKKVKTFSEMVEERASKGRTLSLCLFSNPLGLDDWSTKDVLKDDSEVSCNDTHQSSQSSGSEESSHENSEDESDVFHNTQTTERNGVKNVNNTQRTRRTGAVHFLGNLNGVNNGISSSTEDNGSNCDFKVSELTLNGESLSHKCEPCQSGAYNDSGLDSLSSSHRAGDIPDSGSDFSQDSGSSLDCDSPGITGIPTSGTELLEEFSSKDVRPSNGMISHKEVGDGMELCLKLTLTDSKSQQYGFTITGGKDKGSPVTVASVINGSISDLVGLKTGDHILAINKEDITSLSHSAVISSLKQSAESKQLELLVWRAVSTNVKQEKPTVNGSSTTTATSESPKKAVPEQTTNKETSNKTNSKTAKVSSVPDSSVDNKVNIVDAQSNNKKSAPMKQKDTNSKTPASTKPQAQETSGTTSEAAKANVESTVSTAENQHGKSVESENEMFVDDIHSSPVSNSSKIPVAERSPKVMGKKMSKPPQESKKTKPPMGDSGKCEGNAKKANGTAVEDSKDGLNIIYQSQPSVPKADSNAKELVSADSEHCVPKAADKKVVNESPKSPTQTSTNKQEPKFNEKLTFETSEILPVDKVAEQMERLILEQLEEEERLKEKPMNSEASLHGSVITTTANVLSEHELSGIDTPPRQVEPPKEKPPPPPTSSSSTNKDSPLKRVNSTKRIKKEIQKRRSDFLGIEKPEEEESTIPPPPDLENILKLECEQERKVREMLGKESLHQRESSFEEEEIARKEREIIENLETEERIRMTKQTVKDESIPPSPGDASLAQIEAERIRKLQEERVRMEEERFLKEEQRIRLEEERQLREREEQIRREEESTLDVSATASSTALTTNSENTALVSPISSSVSKDASLSETGDGKNKDTACMPSASGDQSSIAKDSANNLVPTKPLKKKEVIRKERERLRQEQEALQREREEYRRQMMKEQELLKESQKPHAPDAPVSRVGAPPPLKPALPLPLTSLPHASQALKENVIYTSRSPPANSVSAAVGNNGAASQSIPVLSPPHNAAARPKATQNDARGPHKVAVKKQLDASSESRYNQNHWLIQEAEMRRISEQKERQRVHPSGDPRCAPAPFNQGQYHPMHMTEENYCGAVPGALQKPPVIPGAPSSYPAPTTMHSPEQQWNYGQPVHPTSQNRKFPVSNVLSPGTEKIQPSAFSRSGRVDPSMQPPTKPSRVIPMDRQEHMLSVSGRKRCSHCGEELGRGAAMIIESLQLYYHIQCFRCCVCQAQLGNGSCGTDVRVRNNKLHCHNCYSNDEAGLKFSQV